MSFNFHDGMTAKVTIGGQESDPFDVLAGVKQGCVLAPVIFNLFLARDSIYAIARYMPSPVRLSVRPSVCHTGGSVKDG